MRYIGLILLIILSGCKNQIGQERPNIILFVVDDLGWTDLSSYGSDLYQTPNVDNLLANGVKFTNAYASCTVCSPSRASLMTGKYPARLHCTDWISGHQKPFAKMAVPNWTEQVSLEEVTLAEALKANGYQTIHLGKWHLGESEELWPEHQGFDVNIGGWSKGAPQKKNNGNGYFSPYANPRLENGLKGEYLTERLTDEALDYLENTKDSQIPFFMNFWFYNVHTPLQAKKEKVEKYNELIQPEANHKNPTYAAMIEHMDDAIGSIVQKLKQQDKLDNTIIIFTSDNGGLIGNYRLKEKVTSNKPLKSGKGDMYEGGVRVPFVVQWLNKIPKGKIVEEPLMSIDVYPTVLELTSNNEKQNIGIDGVDFSKVLLEETKINRPAIFWHYPHYHLEGAKPYSAVRKGDWKLIQIFERDTLELYNLKDDIGETMNLINANPIKAKELLLDLNTWRVEVNAQMPKPNTNFNPDFEEVYKKGKWLTKSDIEFLEHLKSTSN